MVYVRYLRYLFIDLIVFFLYFFLLGIVFMLGYSSEWIDIGISFVGFLFCREGSDFISLKVKISCFFVSVMKRVKG